MKREDRHCDNSVVNDSVLCVTSIEELAKLYGIICIGNRYVYGSYRFDKLADAITCAKLCSDHGDLKYNMLSYANTEREALEKYNITGARGGYSYSGYTFKSLEDVLAFAIGREIQHESQHILQHIVLSGGEYISAQDAIRETYKMKSYRRKAAKALIMYFFGAVVVGMVMNILYLNDARETQRITGYEPDGKGCLLDLLLMPFYILLALLIVAAFAMRC